MASSSNELGPGAETGRASLDYNSGPARRPDLHVELFPLHSPLLGESWLVSFPPLSYMLKSSGSSCLIGGPTMDVREFGVPVSCVSSALRSGRAERFRHRLDLFRREDRARRTGIRRGAYPGSARCVQSFDDSLASAIRKTYRISLRSSSLWEPRHPSLKVVCIRFACGEASRRRRGALFRVQIRCRRASGWTSGGARRRHVHVVVFNDPSAGSPTETLLRLHLPLNDEV
ncbi:unnamed protein product [Phaeothamnion confervicola]